MNTRQSRIAHLKELDTGFQVFGAKGHRYETHPLSLDDVDRFESALDVGLPDQYRQHLLGVGYGAGPYYGLYSPEWILKDLAANYQEYAENSDDFAAEPSPSIAFPFTRSDARRIHEALAAGNGSACGTALYPSPGAITIATHGCSYDTVLVTAGELRGTVWDLDQEGCSAEYSVTPLRSFPWAPATWHPSLCAPCLFGGLGERFAQRLLSDLPTFDEWFDSWLALATFGLTKSATRLDNGAHREGSSDSLARRRWRSFWPGRSDR